MKKAVYLRVSKKELNEKTQLPVILKNFKLKESEVIVFDEVAKEKAKIRIKVRD